MGGAVLAAAALAAPTVHAETSGLQAEGRLQIAGALAPDLRLVWRLDYVTTAPLAMCQFLDDVTGLMIARLRTGTVLPGVDGGGHTASVALAESDEPECGWALRTVYACVARAAALDDGPGNCIPLLVAGATESRDRKLSLAIDCQTSRACTLTDVGFQPRRFERSSQSWAIDFVLAAPAAPGTGV